MGARRPGRFVASGFVAGARGARGDGPWRPLACLDRHRRDLAPRWRGTRRRPGPVARLARAHAPQPRGCRRERPLRRIPRLARRGALAERRCGARRSARDIGRVGDRARCPHRRHPEARPLAVVVRRGRRDPAGQRSAAAGDGFSDVDQGHPLVADRSVKAEVGGGIVFRQGGHKAQMVRVLGPRSSGVGPIGRLRATLRPFVVRVTPGGAPAIGGTDAGAVDALRTERPQRRRRSGGSAG